MHATKSCIDVCRPLPNLRCRTFCSPPVTSSRLRTTMRYSSDLACTSVGNRYSLLSMAYGMSFCLSRCVHVCVLCGYVLLKSGDRHPGANGFSWTVRRQGLPQRHLVHRLMYMHTARGVKQHQVFGFAVQLSRPLNNLCSRCRGSAEDLTSLLRCHAVFGNTFSAGPSGAAAHRPHTSGATRGVHWRRRRGHFLVLPVVPNLFLLRLPYLAKPGWIGWTGYGFTRIASSFETCCVGEIFKTRPPAAARSRTRRDWSSWGVRRKWRWL